MLKKAIAIIIKVAVTVGLFTLLFHPEFFKLDPDIFGGITPGGMLEELQGIELSHLLPWLLFAAVVKLAGMMAGVWRWRLLLQGQGLSIPLRHLIQSWFVGRTIGIFLPGTIGLDGYRLYDSALYTGDVVKSTTVIAVEKLIGVIALTFLMFITFPLGFYLLDINPVVFACIVAFLGACVTGAFLLLLNPRVIQVLVAVLPAPQALKGKINKLGAAATAYSGNRVLLIKATFCGLLVHLGTCFMFFGTMMAIRAANTSLWDILFASPVMIYGTVLGPSVGGEGIRELVFVTLLTSTKTSSSALFAHLGWWVGEFVPFVIGLPIFVIRSRRPRAEMQAELASMRQEAASKANTDLHLSPEEVTDYRAKLINCALAGILAGLVAGALIGLGEARWLIGHQTGLEEWAAYWWAPAVYGLLFPGLGLGVAGGLAFLYLLANRFPRPAFTGALCLGGTLAAGVLVIGRFRYGRDVLAGHGLNLVQNLQVAGAAITIGLVAALVAAIVLARIKGHRRNAIVGGLAVYALVVISGTVLSGKVPPVTPPEFSPNVEAKGPNIILLAADALRADYLPLYSPEAAAKTPNLQKFAKDAIVFESEFSQASWTKPAFATIFSGRYPESHRATTKMAGLPDEITTWPEVLQSGGYYTKGFANNPNILASLGFDQGFVDYVDLKPGLYFGARQSCVNLTIYQILRRVRIRVARKMDVTQFYQPAETVTAEGLAWLDSAERPKDTPFMLFLHYMDSHDPFMDHDKPGVGYARAKMEHPDPDKLLEPMKKAYNDEIEHMDSHLGTLLEGLKERGLYENSLIVFLADHGEEFYDHKGWWHGQTLYDELIHVPFVLKQPGNAGGGTRNAHLARHIDVGPTFLHFAGLPKPDEMPGTSIIAAGGACANEAIMHVYAENDFEGIVLQAVRTAKEKVIRANEGNKRDLAPLEYYDLDRDPAEQENLAGKGEGMEAELNQLIDKMIGHIQEGAAAPSLMDDMSEEQIQQLKDLGYLE